MERQLHELLRLSRIGRVVNPSERVPFGPVVTDAVSLLRSRLEERGIRLVVDEPLPDVFGDRVRLVEVVQNLVENASKFHAADGDRFIHVGARPPRDGGGPVIFVADNGIGIDPRHHEKVFGLFHKLDARAEGTGVGLALVRRIVEVHGGQSVDRVGGPRSGDDRVLHAARAAAGLSAAAGAERRSGYRYRRCSTGASTRPPRRAAPATGRSCGKASMKIAAVPTAKISPPPSSAGIWSIRIPAWGTSWDWPLFLFSVSRRTTWRGLAGFPGRAGPGVPAHTEAGAGLRS